MAEATERSTGVSVVLHLLRIEGCLRRAKARAALGLPPGARPMGTCSPSTWLFVLLKLHTLRWALGYSLMYALYLREFAE